MPTTYTQYAPNFSVTNPQTLGPITNPSQYKATVDASAMGAGDTIAVSVQTLQTTGGAYKETETFIVSTPVVIPAAPAAGYEPLKTNGQEWYDSLLGIQFVLTYTAASGNTIPNAAIPVTLTQGY